MGSNNDDDDHHHHDGDDDDDDDDDAVSFIHFSSGRVKPTAPKPFVVFVWFNVAFAFICGFSDCSFAFSVVPVVRFSVFLFVGVCCC